MCCRTVADIATWCALPETLTGAAGAGGWSLARETAAAGRLGTASGADAEVEAVAATQVDAEGEAAAVPQADAEVEAAAALQVDAEVEAAAVPQADATAERTIALIISCSCAGAMVTCVRHRRRPPEAGRPRSARQ